MLIINFSLSYALKWEISYNHRFKTQQDDNNHTILFNNYYYSYLQTVKIEQGNNTIELNNNEVSSDTQLALDTNDIIIRGVGIQYIIVIYDGKNYKIFSNLLSSDDRDTDKKFKKNPIIDIEYNKINSNNRSLVNHYIVSTCVEGQDIYFIHPKDGLFYIPEKICQIYSNDNPTISRIKDIKQHSYQLPTTYVPYGTKRWGLVPVQWYARDYYPFHLEVTEHLRMVD